MIRYRNKYLFLTCNYSNLATISPEIRFLDKFVTAENILPWYLHETKKVPTHVLVQKSEKCIIIMNSKRLRYIYLFF